MSRAADSCQPFMPRDAMRNANGRLSEPKQAPAPVRLDDDATWFAPRELAHRQRLSTERHDRHVSSLSDPDPDRSDCRSQGTRLLEPQSGLALQA